MEAVDTIVFISLRASGPNVHKDRIVQLTAFAPSFTTVPTLFDVYINPNLPGTATTVLSSRIGVDLTCQAPFTKQGAEFLYWLAIGLAGRTGALVAHNGHRFHFPLLTKEMQRYGFRLQPMLKVIHLWDSMHLIRGLADQGVVSGVRPMDIMRAWHMPVPEPSTQGDIQSLLVVLSEAARRMNLPTYLNILRVSNLVFIGKNVAHAPWIRLPGMDINSGNNHLTKEEFNTAVASAGRTPIGIPQVVDACAFLARAENSELRALAISFLDGVSRSTQVEAAKAGAAEAEAGAATSAEAAAPEAGPSSAPS